MLTYFSEFARINIEFLHGELSHECLDLQVEELQLFLEVFAMLQLVLVLLDLPEADARSVEAEFLLHDVVQGDPELVKPY